MSFVSTSLENFNLVPKSWNFSRFGPSGLATGEGSAKSTNGSIFTRRPWETADQQKGIHNPDMKVLSKLLLLPWPDPKFFKIKISLWDLQSLAKASKRSAFSTDLPFLAFSDFLAFFVARNFLLFFWAFSFPKDFSGSAERKILVFWGGFPCFSPKKARKGRSGFGVKRKRKQFWEDYLGNACESKIVVYHRNASGGGPEAAPTFRHFLRLATKSALDECFRGQNNSRARKPWSANCELKHWNFRGWKCLP